MERVLLLACALVSLLTVQGSPNSKSINPDVATRYSNDIYEDARLDVPDLIKKYRYPVEVHDVTTSDGYILQMHRIPHGRDSNNDPNVSRPVVFVMHGLLSSSADWVIMGPGKGIAYILAEEGFDVWMGNARGNYYSRRHLTLRPDALLNTDFWDYSWHEIGHIDLPTMIDYVLSNTGRSRLQYIGHSQGTTAFWVMASTRPEYNNKIISMHALAPVAFMEHVENLLLRFIAPFSHTIEVFTSMFGVGEFLPNNNIMTWAGQKMCEDEVSTQSICSNILFLMGGRNEDQLNTTVLPIIMGHTPAGSSSKQFAHYGQGIDSAKFRQYDYGWLSNRFKYGSYSPPTYDLKKITTPVFLHYSDSDPMAHIHDVDNLFCNLGAPIGKFRVQQHSFSHLDFMWGIDAKQLVYDRVINLLHAMEPTV